MRQEMHDRQHAALRIGVGSQNSLALRKGARVVGHLALEETQRVRPAEPQDAQVKQTTGCRYGASAHHGIKMGARCAMSSVRRNASIKPSSGAIFWQTFARDDAFRSRGPSRRRYPLPAARNGLPFRPCRARWADATAQNPRVLAIGSCVAAVSIFNCTSLTQGLMPARARPISPHLQIYRWQIGNSLSILHRLTGIALSLGLCAPCYWLVSLAAGTDPMPRLQGSLRVHSGSCYSSH